MLPQHRFAHTPDQIHRTGSVTGRTFHQERKELPPFHFQNINLREIPANPNDHIGDKLQCLLLPGMFPIK